MGLTPTAATATTTATTTTATATRTMAATTTKATTTTTTKATTTTSDSRFDAKKPLTSCPKFQIKGKFFPQVWQKNWKAAGKSRRKSFQ